jgi:hypothetical protein
VRAWFAGNLCACTIVSESGHGGQGRAALDFARLLAKVRSCSSTDSSLWQMQSCVPSAGPGKVMMGVVYVWFAEAPKAVLAGGVSVGMRAPHVAAQCKAGGRPPSCCCNQHSISTIPLQCTQSYMC